MNFRVWTSERREQIASCLRAGYTASQISRELGVSRKAILGVVHRDKELSDIGFEHTRRRLTGQVSRMRRPKVVKRASPAPAPRPEPVREPEPIATHEPHVAPVTLMMLDARRCKWPVNDPEVKQPYLFCGCTRATGRPYCAFHEDKARGNTLRPISVPR